MGLPYGENCMILTPTIFDWSTRVTDRRTDGRTDGQTDGRNCDSICALSIYAVARKNLSKCGSWQCCLFQAIIIISNTNSTYSMITINHTRTIYHYARCWWPTIRKGIVKLLVRNVAGKLAVTGKLCQGYLWSTALQNNRSGCLSLYGVSSRQTKNSVFTRWTKSQPLNNYRKQPLRLTAFVKNTMTRISSTRMTAANTTAYCIT